MTLYTILEIILGLLLVGYGIYYGFIMKPGKAALKNQKYISGTAEEKEQILRKLEKNQHLAGIALLILGLLFIVKQFLFL